MTEYQKTYIELKKQFVATNEGPDSVRALYTFKEELEQSEDQQAKEVLVDVYDLLDFKKDAYELLCQIGNRSDKKDPQAAGHAEGLCGKLGQSLCSPQAQKRRRKSRKRRNSRPSWACPPSGITQTLWKLGLLRNPQTALSATAAARRPIFSIQPPFTLWRILHICAQSASPTAKQPGNMTVVFKMISLWTMV